MGTSFFKSRSPTKIGGSNLNLEARAIGAPGFSGRAAGGRAQKDLGAALGLSKAGGAKKVTGSSAYAPGPKKV